jgi:hypothetical protein
MQVNGYYFALIADFIPLGAIKKPYPESNSGHGLESLVGY